MKGMCAKAHRGISNPAGPCGAGEGASASQSVVAVQAVIVI